MSAIDSVIRLLGDNKSLTVVGAIIVFALTQLPLLALRLSMSASCRWQKSSDPERQILSLNVAVKNVGILKFRVVDLHVKIWETNEPNANSVAEWFRPDVCCKNKPLCETDKEVANHVYWNYYA
ncbi:MAG TPA: hypothetical protein VN419_12895, partial [Humidesulfovibrio sp.]|uniref:hypothetical protein n=1 Tax=Humidesulfovibrio sp. TaxID=2910988 RepID=UPI002C1261C5